MRKAILYYKHFVNIIEEISTPLSKDELLKILSIIDTFKSDETCDPEYAPDDTIQNAVKFVKMTAVQRTAFLNKSPKNYGVLLFSLYALTKAYLVHLKDTQELFYNSKIPYKTFASKSLQNLFSLSKNAVLDKLYFFVSYTYQGGSISYYA